MAILEISSFLSFHLIKFGDNQLTLRSQDQKFQNRYYQTSPSDTILKHFSPPSGLTINFSFFLRSLIVFQLAISQQNSSPKMRMASILYVRNLHTSSNLSIWNSTV